MVDMIWLVPLIPLLSSILLMLGSATLPRVLIGLLGGRGSSADVIGWFGISGQPATLSTDTLDMDAGGRF